MRLRTCTCDYWFEIDYKNLDIWGWLESWIIIHGLQSEQATHGLVDQHNMGIYSNDIILL